jgi:hypothetical protein
MAAQMPGGGDFLTHCLALFLEGATKWVGPAVVYA